MGITLAVFWPVGHLGFIIYDDCEYVYLNSFVQSGLNLKSIAWAFTADYSSNWHPITWLSHMLDCQLFGLNPGEEHWMNLGIHTANCLLLYALLWWLTGARWRSFLVAGLFAIHPLHVQSVAWIAERKDVLSGFFGLLTLMAYATWVKAEIGKSDSGNFATKDHKETRYAKNYYWLAVGLFALGLMAKPMLVTIPLVMLLLDYWPLGRVALDGRQAFLDSLRPLVVEKMPFFALCLGSCILTLWAQTAGQAVVSMAAIPWSNRCLHAVLSYSLYVKKILWPVHLAIFYPYNPLSFTKFIVFLLLPVLFSLVILRRGRSQPYLFVGWFWFVITLIPVIGFVQVGLQTMADRYTYLPGIGLFILLAWSMAEFAARSKFWRIGMAGVAGLLLLACGLDSRYQLSFWQDDITLFKRVVQVTPINNAMGYAYLGIAYQQAGDLEAAAESYTSALNATPDFPEVRTRLGTIQLQQKKYAAAEEQFRQLLTLHPDFVPVRKFLGCALAGQGKYQAARDEFEKLLNLQPDDDFTLKAMTEVSQKLAAEDALTNLFATMKDQPTSEIHAQIADLEASLGNYSEAVEHYQSALKLNPEAPEVENNLAWLLATCSDTTVRDGQQAVTLAQRACEQTGYGKTIYLGTLGAALAEAGRFDDAVASAQKACASASAHGENDLLKRNQELLALYQRHEPWHDPLPLPQPIPESPFESGSP